MGAGKDVDAVDLEQADPVQRPSQPHPAGTASIAGGSGRAGVGAAGTGRIGHTGSKPLGGEGDSPRRRQADPFRRHRRDAALVQSFFTADRCALRCLFISNMLADFLPKIFSSLSSALI